MRCRLVAYYRVSTKKQGDSGLGLEAQESAVAAHVASTACDLIASYTEVESGRKSDRTELGRAIAHAKRSKATLVIAKLDRLSRNVAFIANLMESGVAFIACDNPSANHLLVHVMAAFAEAEAKAISKRTKEALAAAKARGVRLGTNNLTRDGGIRGVAAAARAKREKKRAAYEDLAPLVRSLRTEGLSLRTIAARLNDDGHTTRTGKPWNPMQVSRLLGVRERHRAERGDGSS